MGNSTFFADVQKLSLVEPELDTTSSDNAAAALESRSYFIRKTGSDGFRIGYQST